MGEEFDALRLFARQALRTVLVDDWLHALAVRSGDTLVDLGCGTGYVTLRAAMAVGTTGTVHAVDSNADALAFLQDLARLHGLNRIHCHEQDIPRLAPLPQRPRGALLTMVLHHLPEPARALAHIAGALRGAPIVVAEFDATGPCRIGPPRAMRLGRADVEAVVEAAGMTPTGFHQQTPEHWFLLAKSAA